MKDCRQFYIDGKWVKPAAAHDFPVINPATEEQIAVISLGTAAGCTMVLKPSEIAPLSGYLFTQILHDAGVPAGVFNMVNGDGPTVGTAISSHPGVDMVSFTGSTRAGVAVATAAAPTVKRAGPVTQGH